MRHSLDFFRRRRLLAGEESRPILTPQSLQKLPAAPMYSHNQGRLVRPRGSRIDVEENAKAAAVSNGRK